MKKKSAECSGAKSRHNVLVALDGTRAAGRALVEAGRMVERIGGQLTVVSVLPSLCLPEKGVERTSRMERFMKGVREAFGLEGIRVETIIYESKDPVKAIIDLAKGLSTDFIVIGAHWERARRSSRWGRVSALIAQTAPCAVLVV